MADQIDYQVVLQELLGKARHAAEQAAQSDAYHQGLRMAYYDLISFALDQGKIFGVSAADLGLAGFDPQDLLREPATEKSRQVA